MDNKQRPYKDLDSDTLQKVDAMLQRLLTQIGEDNLGKMAAEYKDSDNIIPNGFYFIKVENPFANPYKTSDTPFSEWVELIESWGDYSFFKDRAPDDNKYITCIGIADVKKKRIWLVNTFNNSQPAYLDYKDKGERPGWYFSNSGREYYTVYIPRYRAGYAKHPLYVVNALVHPTDEKRNFIYTYIKPERLIIKSLTGIKEQWPKFEILSKEREAEELRIKEEQEKLRQKQEAEEKAAREREAREKAERDRIAKEAAIHAEKKKEEFFKDYTYIGCQSPGSPFPKKEYRELYNEIRKDPEFKWVDYESDDEELPNHRGRIFSGTLYNPKYKVYMTYAGDSTD